MNIINFKIFLFLNNFFLDIIGLPVNNEVVSDIVSAGVLEAENIVYSIWEVATKNININVVCLYINKTDSSHRKIINQSVNQ